MYFKYQNKCVEYNLSKVALPFLSMVLLASRIKRTEAPSKRPTTEQQLKY